MNVRLLIDAVVRQTTVLIAQLATSGGLRAPLAHVAGQVFLELAKELESQGVPTKVRADMFGMALRTYQRRTQRLAQSRTDRGRSLWEAIFDFLGESGMVAREDLFRRFRRDDEASVRGVLRDLTESGLVFVSGSGRSTTYRTATRDEIGKMRTSADLRGRQAFVWSIVFRVGPATLDRLTIECGMAEAELEPLLSMLVAAGRMERVELSGSTVYRSRELVIGFEDPAGWEAAVLDHFSAFVKTIAQKLTMDQSAGLGDEVGGSTYHFTIWRGHPLERDVLGELRGFRERMSELRAKIDRFNDEHEHAPQLLKVDAYYGQCVTEEDNGDVDASDHEP